MQPPNTKMGSMFVQHVSCSEKHGARKQRMKKPGTSEGSVITVTGPAPPKKNGRWGDRYEF
jgi:hypothetical protein